MRLRPGRESRTMRKSSELQVTPSQTQQSEEYDDDQWREAEGGVRDERKERRAARSPESQKAEAEERETTDKRSDRSGSMVGGVGGSSMEEAYAETKAKMELKVEEEGHFDHHQRECVC